MDMHLMTQVGDVVLSVMCVAWLVFELKRKDRNTLMLNVAAGCVFISSFFWIYALLPESWGIVATCVYLPILAVWGYLYIRMMRRAALSKKSEGSGPANEGGDASS